MTAVVGTKVTALAREINNFRVMTSPFIADANEARDDAR